MKENEEIKWEIPEESEESEKGKEEQESESEEEEELENIIKTPTHGFRRMDGEQITPFLEQEPIENLERDLENVPGQPAQAQQVPENPEEAVTYAAPFYSAREDYEEMRPRGTEDIQIDITGGGLTQRETEIPRMAERRVNFARWQEANVERFEPQQEERYQVRQPEQFKPETSLPFEQEKKEKRRRVW